MRLKTLFKLIKCTTTQDRGTMIGGCGKSLCALMSLGSTVTIVVMLAVYNKKLLQVLRYGITLNAMLSVLSAIAKAKT